MLDVMLIRQIIFARRYYFSPPYATIYDALPCHMMLDAAIYSA